MSNSRLLSGKVKKVTGYRLNANRTQFIDLANTEPDLGVPQTVGNGGVSLLVSDAQGNRSWQPAAPANGVSTFTFTTGTLNFRDIGDLTIYTPGGLIFTATVSLNTTTVTTGTYGSTDFIPVVTVDEYGRITTITTTTVNTAGIQFNTQTGELIIINNGGSTTTSLTLDPFTNTDVTFANLTLKGALYGPENFVIDPATTGTAAGTVIIRGNLQVEGTQTIIDSVTLNVEDKNILLAKGATTSSQADGAGLTVNLGSETNTSFYYDYGIDSWRLDRPLIVPNLLAATASITATDITVGIFSNKESLTTSTLASNDQFIVHDVSSGTVKITTLADFGIQAARAAFNFGPTPPPSPQPGDRWIDSETMIELVYIYDGDSFQWIEISSAGPQGLPGFTGSQGSPTGYTGSNGRDGTSVTILGSTSTYTLLPGYPSSYVGTVGDGYLTNDNGHLWVWSGLAWIDAGEIRGPQGIAGYVGSEGFQGYTGSIGYAGSQGITGFVGSQGIPGTVAGRGYTGSIGDIGFSGSVGYSGSRGFTGSSAPGYAGSVGYTGSIGYTGSYGVQGYTGSSAPGYSGSQGAGFTGSVGGPGYTGSMGEVTLTGGQTLVNKTFAGVVIQGFITETVYTNTGTFLTPNDGTWHVKTLTSNIQWQDALVDGQSMTLLLNNGSSYTVAWPTMVWVSSAGNVTPILTAKDFLVFWKIDNILYGSYIGSGAI